MQDVKTKALKGFVCPACGGRKFKVIYTRAGHYTRNFHTKARDVIAKLEGMKLFKAAQTVREGVEETLTYFAFPREHHRHIYTNNPLETINKQIRRRTRVVGCFPDGHSALMLAAARLRHIAGTQWGLKRYMNMDRLKEMKRQQQEKQEVMAG